MTGQATAIDIINKAMDEDRKRPRTTILISWNMCGTDDARIDADSRQDHAPQPTLWDITEFLAVERRKETRACDVVPRPPNNKMLRGDFYECSECGLD